MMSPGDSCLRSPPLVSRSYLRGDEVGALLNITIEIEWCCQRSADYRNIPSI